MLENKKKSRKFLEFPCIKFTQGQHELVLFAVKAKTLWDIVKINTFEEDKEVGYQRVLSPARAQKIGKFIDAGNVLPNSLLISFDGAELKQNGKVLRVPNNPSAGWVIDGQHRLAGAFKATVPLFVPVVAFVGLKLVDQINCFVTINREQRGVPSSLYYELLKQLPNTKSEAEIVQERAADLATLLKNDEESPLHGRIVIQIAPKKGELSLTNFVRKVAPLLKRGARLATFADEEKAGILNNYFKAFAQVFPKEYDKLDSIFFKTLGFGAIINVLPTFIDLTLQIQKAFRVSDAVTVLKGIEDFNFSGWHERGTGNAAELQAAEDLRVELLSSVTATDTSGGIKLK